MQRRALVTDVVLAAVLTVAQLVMVAVVADGDCGCEPVPFVGYLLLGASTAVLALRRRVPITTWAVAAATTAVYGYATWPDPPLYLGALAALFTVALRCRTRDALLVGLTSLGLVGVAAIVDPAQIDANDVLAPSLTVALVWLLGRHMAQQRQRLQLSRERNVQLEREGETVRERAVAEERLRIARELHDITAHHVSVISVQAEVAAADPAQTERALAAIGSSARAALVDLRRMLRVLRSEDESGEREPQPSLASLSDLFDSVRTTGLVVTEEVDPRVGSLSDDRQLAVYRIVQEALTNVVRHADARSATVAVLLGDGTVEVEVADDGVGPSDLLEEGHGLHGIGERARVHGGAMSVRRGAAGGFVLRVVIPS